jgi:hypothetical protein
MHHVIFLRRRRMSHIALIALAMGSMLSPSMAAANCGWKFVPTPNASISQNYFTSVSATSPYDAWAAGFFANDPNFVQTITEHWNGHVWAIVPSPNPGSQDNRLASVSATSPSDAWAAGWYFGNDNIVHTLTEHWNGHVWTVVPSPDPDNNTNHFNGIWAMSPSDAWAAGYYHGNDNIDRTLTEHWNGHAWTVVPSPNPANNANYLFGVSAISPSNAWAAGYYRGNDNLFHILIEHWNGRVWAVVPSPEPPSKLNVLYGVSATSPSNAWAAGWYFGNDNIVHTLTEHWNGHVWAIVPSPFFLNNTNYLYAISTTSASDAWTAGLYKSGDIRDHTLVEHWNGSAWAVVPSAETAINENSIYGISAISPSDAWAAGSYTTIDLTVHTLIEQWKCNR